MSTRKKDVSVVREKRAPSTSHLKSTSKTVSTSEKATPNYLKPTLSSSHSSGEARRRSFDKAPSPARTTKTRGVSPSSTRTTKTRGVSPSPTRTIKTRGVSPSPTRTTKTRGVSPSPTRTTKTRGVSPTPTSRWSSISGKTGAGRAVASAKSDGRLKGTREAGKQHLYARAVGTLKKSAAVASKSKKAETATALRKKDSSDHEESPIVGDEEDAAGMPDQELDSSNEQTQGEMDDTVSEQRDASIGEAVSPAICEESDDNVPKIESPTLLGQDEAEAEAVNDADAAKAESPVSSEQHVECPADSEQASRNSSQQKEVEVVAEDGEAAPRLSQEKKDTALSNNVTEEMTLEQRRNKFRALAGAFETAIARQEHK
ncbi:flocculation protein FLO11-like [Salvia hispanica]|uniref:flocculation protein FLO11-like n=1 Tax=Salvia hispanica TaxID=49212 RepID=UPI0020092341|nr:flocculation protein FLO11-like [Salvia hispanica]